MSSISAQFEAVAVPAGYKDADQIEKPCFRIFYNDVYEVILPKGHRFPMNKYQQVRKRVQKAIESLPIEDRGIVNCGTQNVSKKNKK